MATSTTPCFLHEITNCSICSGLDKKLAAEEASPQFDAEGWDGVVAAINRHKPGTVPARYAGKCASCGEWFKAGTLIRSDNSGGWVCCP